MWFKTRCVIKKEKNYVYVMNNTQEINYCLDLNWLWTLKNYVTSNARFKIFGTGLHLKFPCVSVILCSLVMKKKPCDIDVSFD